jgi:hypothetical protein
MSPQRSQKPEPIEHKERAPKVNVNHGGGTRKRRNQELAIELLFLLDHTGLLLDRGTREFLFRQAL